MQKSIGIALAGAGVLAGLGLLGWCVVIPYEMRQTAARNLAQVPGLSVGAMDQGYWGPTLTLEQVRLARGTTTITADRMTISDPAAQGLAALTGSHAPITADLELDNALVQTPDLAARLPAVLITQAADNGDANPDLRLDAAQITIPSLTANLLIGGHPASLEAHQITITGLSHGTIGHLTTGLTRYQLSFPNPETITVGTTETTNLNLPAYVNFRYGQGDASTPYSHAYDQLIAQNVKLIGQTNAGQVALSLSRLLSGSTDLRPMPQPYDDFAQEIGDTPPSLRAVGQMLGLYRAVRLAGVALDGLTCDVILPTRRSIHFTLGQIMLSDIGDGRIGDYALNRFEMTSDKGHFAIARIDFAGIDLNPTIDGLAAYNLAKPDVGTPNLPTADQALALLPTLRHFEIDGIALGVGHPAQNIFALREFALDGAGISGGLPSHLRFQLRDLQMLMPPQNPASAAMRQLGVPVLDASAQFTADWDQDAGSLALSDGALSFNHLATLNLAAQLTGLPRAQLLHKDFNSAGLSSVDLRLANSGLVERLIALFARTRHLAPSAAPAGFAAQLNSALAKRLAGSLLLAPLQQALPRFSQHPQSLELREQSARPVPLAHWQSL